MDEGGDGQVGWRQVRKGSVCFVRLSLYSTGDEQLVKCLAGELYSRFAYKVTLQHGQMENNLETLLLETQIKWHLSNACIGHGSLKEAEFEHT